MPVNDDAAAGQVLIRMILCCATARYPVDVVALPEFWNEPIGALDISSCFESYFLSTSA
jgi:hypothetical protein